MADNSPGTGYPLHDTLHGLDDQLHSIVTQINTHMGPVRAENARRLQEHKASGDIFMKKPLLDLDDYASEGHGSFDTWDAVRRLRNAGDEISNAMKSINAGEGALDEDDFTHRCGAASAGRSCARPLKGWAAWHAGDWRHAW